MSDTALTQLTAVEAGGRVRRVHSGLRITLVVRDDSADHPATRVVEVADGATLTLGRSRTCDIVIDTDRVSRVHATFTRRGTSLVVEDAGSRNGTWVNQAQLAGPRRVYSGDEVVAGSAVVDVHITNPVARPIRIEPTRVLEERLAAEVDRGLHYGRRLGLALFELPSDPTAADPASDRAGDAIASALRPMDVIAEYAPGVLAVVMPELDAVETERAATALAAAARAALQEGPVLAVGVASFPEHSTTVGGLIARARAALADAHRAGATAVALPPEDRLADLGDVIVADPAMHRVYALVRKVADHAITVLIEGETGVGKEVVAAAIHAASPRRKGPLVRVNCASVPENLLESALFGHERGAFTGAERKQVGYFEAAHGGTLFLDEIGEMAPALQAKLLRALESRRIVRVGAVEELEVDVRVVCATHRDLEAEVRAGTFRSDLYFRIGGFTIPVPPLRERPGELEPLARAFVQTFALAMRRPVPAISDDAIAAMRAYQWPGNVRELRNALERAVVLCSEGVIDVADLPDGVREGPALAPADPVALPIGGHRDIRDHIAEMERTAIATALEITHGNQTEAAKQLGISRRTLIYRMEKHGLKPKPAR